MWILAGEEAMKQSIQISKKSGFESVEGLPRTAVGFSSNAYQDLPPQLRLSATSRSIPNAYGLHRTTRFLMQEYINLVDREGLELPSTKRRCIASVNKFERSPMVLSE